MRYAVINLETNIVENVIIWDGNGALYPFDTASLIQLIENERCSISDLYDPNQNPRFIEQAPVEE
jgi:hypothetical protein